MRNLCLGKALLTALLFAVACAPVVAQSAGDNANNDLAATRVFPYDATTVKTAPNGAMSRLVARGTLATGEVVSVHETTQPAGTKPNAAHTIQHSEVILVEEGTLEFTHDGNAERVDAGSVIYVARGTLHAVRNIGAGPAKYVVIQIGGDTKH
jgi:quercetin dioxygenase-like cupin family protein